MDERGGDGRRGLNHERCECGADKCPGRPFCFECVERKLRLVMTPTFGKGNQNKDGDDDNANDHQTTGARHEG